MCNYNSDLIRNEIIRYFISKICPEIRLPREIFEKILTHVKITDFENLEVALSLGHSHVENDYKTWLMNYTSKKSFCIICPICYCDGLAEGIFDSFLFQCQNPSEYIDLFLHGSISIYSLRDRVSKVSLDGAKYSHSSYFEGQVEPGPFYEPFTNGKNIKFISRFRHLLNNPKYTFELIDSVLRLERIKTFETINGLTSHIKDHKIGKIKFIDSEFFSGYNVHAFHTFIFQMAIETSQYKTFINKPSHLHRLYAFRDYLNLTTQYHFKQHKEGLNPWWSCGWTYEWEYTSRIVALLMLLKNEKSFDQCRDI